MYVNLHEVSNRTRKVKLVITLFLFGKSKLIVTINDKKLYRRKFKIIEKNIYVVTIESSVLFRKKIMS